MSTLQLSTPKTITVAAYQAQALSIDLIRGLATLRFQMQDQSGNPVGAPQVATLPNTQLMAHMPALLAALTLDMQEGLGVTGSLVPPTPPNQVTVTPRTPTVVAGIAGTGSPP